MNRLKKLFERREPRKHPDPTTLDHEGLRDLFTKKNELPESVRKENDMFTKKGGE